MKKKIIIFSSIGGAILIGLTILILCLCLNKVDKSYRSIKVFKIDGTVNVIRSNKIQTASKDMKLKNNDVVEVKDKSSTVLKLDNDKFVMAKENTTLRLVATGKTNNTKTRILVDKGGVIVEVKEKLKDSESFEIASSNSVMAIRGTQISFDVEVKNNKITTSFAILEGNTEILLLKNEKLSSTTLTKDFRMSYTTDLSEVKSADDIAKLVDKTNPSEIEEVSDNDLATVFNAIKEELTSEEIDSIVDTINEFERDGEEINGVIKFSFNSNPGYTLDPKDFIKIEEDWKDLVGLQYLYSKTIDGEYTEFDSDNPLEIGTWYCKIKAGNAYRSEPLEFSVIQIEIKLNAMSAEIEYLSDPKNSITFKNAPENYTIKYSKTVDGEYSEYSSNDPLELGTWYFTVDAGLAYTFTPISFEVVKIGLESVATTTNLYYDGSTCVKAEVTNDKLIDFFKSDLAQTPNSNLDDYRSIYEYYLLINYSDHDDIESGYEIVIDKDNISKYGSAMLSGTKSVDIFIESKLPDFYELTGSTSYSYQLDNYLDVKYVYLTPSTDSVAGMPTVNALIDYYAKDFGNGDNPIKLIENDGSGGADIETEVSIQDGKTSVNLSNLSGTFYFMIEGTDIKSSVYSFDSSNFTDTPGGMISLSDPSNAIITYNEDESINIYIDLSFNNGDEYNYLLVYDCNKLLIDDETDPLSLTMPKEFVGNTSYLVMENVYDGSYYPKFVGATKKVDGLDYVCFEGGTPSGGMNSNNYSYGYCEPSAELKVTSNKYFVKNSDITIYDLYGKKLADVEESDFMDDYSFTKTITEYTDNSVYVTGMVYATINEYLFDGLETLAPDGLLNDEAFEFVKNKLESDYNIVVKGSNKHTIKNSKFISG
ncbi:MAG: FecR family protein [bacterium]|nr:FecR family protein [bacterium]